MLLLDVPISPSRPMKVGIVGTGHIARQHLACLKELPNVEVAAVCDLSRAMAESAAGRFGVSRWYTSHQRMLDEVRPDVVHVTTPPTSHFKLSMDAIAAGSHVLVEKPATVHLSELHALLAEAKGRGRMVIEDYNYVFNDPVQKVLRLVEIGEFGHVTHVEIVLCLDIAGKGSAFVDENAPHPCLSMDGGAIADFLPHLASLCHAFVGPHKGVSTVWKKVGRSVLPSDEFRALVDAEQGTAELMFSSHTQPDVFWLRVYGTKMRASINLFEGRLTVDRVRNCARPLIPLLNGLDEGKRVRRAAVGSLLRKFSGGPGAYEGLWQLLRRVYSALGSGTVMPVSMRQVEEVNRLVADMKDKDYVVARTGDGSQRVSWSARPGGVPTARPQGHGLGAPGREADRPPVGKGRDLPGGPEGKPKFN